MKIQRSERKWRRQGKAKRFCRDCGCSLTDDDWELCSDCFAHLLRDVEEDEEKDYGGYDDEDD